MEQELAHVCIYGGERVVQQVHVGVTVNGASKGNARLLAAREVDTTLTCARITNINDQKIATVQSQRVCSEILHCLDKSCDVQCILHVNNI